MNEADLKTKNCKSRVLLAYGVQMSKNRYMWKIAGSAGAKYVKYVQNGCHRVRTYVGMNILHDAWLQSSSGSSLCTRGFFFLYLTYVQEVVDLE